MQDACTFVKICYCIISGAVKEKNKILVVTLRSVL